MVDTISRRSALGVGAAGAAALGLAACGGGGGDTAEAPPESSEELSGSIVMWIYPLNDSASAESYQPYVDSFKEKYPNVEVEVVQQPWANREEQLTAAISGGNAPDVVYFNPDFVPRFAVEDLLVNLDDLRDDWDSAFVPAALEAMTYDGSLYSAPILMQASQTFANQKVLDEIGMEGPTTWDELRAVGAAAKEKDYYLLEYAGDATLNHNYYMYLWQAGGEVLSEDMSTAAFNTAEGLEALEFVKEIVDNGWAPTEPISVVLPFEQTDLAQGKVAYSLGTNMRLGPRCAQGPADCPAADDPQGAGRDRLRRRAVDLQHHRRSRGCGRLGPPPHRARLRRVRVLRVRLLLAAHRRHRHP